MAVAPWHILIMPMIITACRQLPFVGPCLMLNLDPGDPVNE
jgi:hypothetical protein